MGRNGGESGSQSSETGFDFLDLPLMRFGKETKLGTGESDAGLVELDRVDVAFRLHSIMETR